MTTDNRNPRNRNNQSLTIIGNDAIEAANPQKTAFPRLAVQAYKRDHGRPRKWQDPQEIIDLAIEYYTLAEQTGEPVTITALCAWMGTTRETMIKMSSGDYSDSRMHLQDGVDFAPFTDAIKHIRHIAEAGAEIMGFQARNPAFAIFALKNYGWKDIQTHETTGSIQHSADPATLKILSEVLSRLSGRLQDDQVIDISPVQEQLPTESYDLLPGRPAIPQDGDKATAMIRDVIPVTGKYTEVIK